MTVRNRPVGGRLLTPMFKAMLLLWAAGTAVGVVRFTQGLGSVTAMNDGYPWGLWIAFDVVVGTGLASGGYAIALLVYVFNKGRYHPLVRPAILTSALGYAISGVAVAFDIGRYWNLWKIPTMPWNWNSTSVLLEVALCMFVYTIVLFVELSPALLERWQAGGSPRLKAMADAWLPRLDRALPFIIAAGLVLPTMHQSSLGTVLLVAQTKVHPLWHTSLLPMLFVLTALGMGYAILYLESIFSSVAFGRAMETRLLASLGKVVGAVLLAFIVVRFAGLAGSGRLGLLFTGGRSAFFWLETAIFAGAALLFLRQSASPRAGDLLAASLLALAAGALYRIDAYLVAYDPGPAYSYFPSLGEMAITLGLVASETMAYLYLIRKFPILAGVVLPEGKPVPAGEDLARARVT